MPPCAMLLLAMAFGATSASAASFMQSRNVFPLKLGQGHVPLFVQWENFLGADLLNVTFVQVGGNCGTNMPECAVGGDPVWEYATRFDWKGVVVEPVPHIFAKLSKNYGPYPNVKPLQALVSNHSGKGKILDRAETSHEISLSRKTGVVVPTYTLGDLWTHLGTQKVDILVVDAEGNEPKILSGNLPEPLPKMVLFEISSMNQADIDGVDRNLRSQGYKLLHKLKHQDEVGKNMDPQDALYGLETVF